MFEHKLLGQLNFLCIKPFTSYELSRLTRIEYGSQKHNYICNIQCVSVYTNVSANYMFRPLLVTPSSGWKRPKHVVGGDICIYTNNLYVTNTRIVLFLSVLFYTC